MDLKKYKNQFEKLHQNELIQDLSNAEDVKFKLKCKDNGFSLNINNFYFSKPVINIVNEENTLKGFLQVNNFRNIYLSYDTLNNKFEESPEVSLINLEDLKNRKFYIKIEHDKEVEIIPYVIHYNNNTKKKLTKITEYGQHVNFEHDDQCRLTFKLVGYGNFRIKNITIMPEG